MCVSPFSKFASLLLLLIASGCVSSTSYYEDGGYDPLEEFNRENYQFNKDLLSSDDEQDEEEQPVAETEDSYDFAQHFSNFSNNLKEPINATSFLLQFKIEQGLGSAVRFGINSLIGLLGIFDVATEAGIEYQQEGLDQVFGFYTGLQTPYLMLPFLGPTTVAELGFGFLGSYYLSVPSLMHRYDWKYGSLNWKKIQYANYAATAGGALGSSNSAKQALDLVESISLDEYILIKDGYLSNYWDDVYEGEGNNPYVDLEDLEEFDEDDILDNW